jgi:hypothetical protein
LREIGIEATRIAGAALTEATRSSLLAGEP